MKGKKITGKLIGVLLSGFLSAGVTIGSAGMADTSVVFAEDGQNTEYTVTFKNNGQGNMPDALKVTSGKTIAQAVNYDAQKLRPAGTVIDGYVFDDSGKSWGLYSDKACTKEFDVFNTPVTKNTTLFVKWVPTKTHKVTFKANGVTADPAAIVVAGSVKEDDLPFGIWQIVNGYEFNGWYTDPSLDSEYYFSTYGSKVDSDITLYAKWEKAYTIHFDTNGVGKAPEDIRTNGRSFELYNPQGVKGKRFAGWHTDKECKNRFNEDEWITEDTTLYAKWENATTHTVKLETDGFGNLPKELYVAHGESLSSSGLHYHEGLDRSGYAFAGWFTSKTGGKEIDWHDYIVTSDVTIYERWSSLSDKVAITFDANGHGEAPNTMEVTPGYYFDTEHLYAQPYNMKDVKGYSFRGWSEEKNSNDTLFYGKRVYENTTFYAVWEPVDNYKVSFNMNGHENATNKPGDFYGEYSFDFSGIDTPVDAGYAFVGWYLDKNCTNKAPYYVDLDSDITFYAKWVKEGDATLSFDSNGHGTAPASIKGKIGDSFEKLTGWDTHYYKLSGTIDKGYAFRGWYLDKACTTEAHYYDILEKNTTLYAKWQAVGTTYNVSFDANGHGTAPKSIKVPEGYYLGRVPKLGEADGYVHLGWALRPNAKVGEMGEEINGDVTLYAIWYKGINSVDIMLADPVVGKEISEPVVTVPYNSNYGYGASWDLWGDDPFGGGLNNFWYSSYREEMDEYGREKDGLFKCDEEYIATIWIHSDASRGFVFSENPDIKVNGKKPDKVFSVEDNRILIGVTQKTGHDWGDWTVTKEPTATEEGLKTRVCRNDPEHIETRAIPRLESVALDKSKIVLDKGKSQTLTATVKAADTTDKSVTWTSSDTKVAAVDRNGKVTAINHGKAVITAKTANGKTATCEVRVSFADVASESLYYYKPVYWAAGNGITTGANGLFAPHNKCTREHAITFLWRMAGSPAPKSMTSKFKDIQNKNSYSYKAIMWGTENGIITGANGVFAPNNTCTREQIVTMLWRLAGKPEPKNTASKFKDVQNKNSYSYKAILWAAEKGITTGANGSFAPGKVCTRAEIVTFIYRYKN